MIVAEFRASDLSPTQERIFCVLRFVALHSSRLAARGSYGSSISSVGVHTS